MIGWEPKLGTRGPWHLTHDSELFALCGRWVADRYVKRDPHKIDHYKGERCSKCWQEWRLETAASLARQDQYFAGKA